MFYMHVGVSLVIDLMNLRYFSNIDYLYLFAQSQFL